MKQASFFADLGELYQILRWVVKQLSPPSDTWVREIELALEEAVTNIIKYAYPSEKKGKIEIFLEEEKNVVTVIVKDYGIPFNPLEQSFSGSCEKEGGFGIFFLKEMVDEIQYSYEKGNVLKLMKKL